MNQGILAYLPLVRRVVRRLARRLPPNVERDDLLAAGVCGLADCLRRNGGGEGLGFEWYARTRIRGAIFDELRAQDWLSRRARAAAATTEGTTAFVSFEEAGTMDANELISGDLREILEARSEQAALARALQQLPARERTVVARYYFEEMRLKDIGAELGVSEPRISQILARAILRLRGLLAKAA